MKILAIKRPGHLPSLQMQYPSLTLKTQFSLPCRNYHHSPLSSQIFSQSKQQRQPSDSIAARVDTSGQVARISHDPDGQYVKFCRPNSSDTISCRPISQNLQKIDFVDEEDKDTDDLWAKMKSEAESDVKQEPILSGYYQGSILSHGSLASALANHLAVKLSNSTIPINHLADLFEAVLSEDSEIIAAVEDDLRAVKQRDPACVSYVHCFLNFKGFLSCQAHRIAHRLWSEGRKVVALLIQNRVSEVLNVDIHPGARIGRGIMLDHATGFVVGETAVIGNNVSILHNVTLGGTGKASGDRHPKIGDGVLIGAGTCILGNIRIGDGAKIGAGSVVLKDVPPRTTAVGNPARLVGGKENPKMLDRIPSFTMDHTSYIDDWSDYVI